MFAAFEAALKQASKDENEWKKTEAGLYAEPPEVKRKRRAEAAATPSLPERGGRMSVGDAEAMLARFATSDAQFR
ncbi:MAG: hypothetical protein ACRED4_07190 [Brevundimonas sp.]